MHVLGCMHVKVKIHVYTWMWCGCECVGLYIFFFPCINCGRPYQPNRSLHPENAGLLTGPSVY